MVALWRVLGTFARSSYLWRQDLRRVEAIKIASYNGAKFLGRDSQIGSITSGKAADLMIVKGNPAANIFDIENVEIVFKDGVGYDSEKLIQSVQGLVGVR